MRTTQLSDREAARWATRVLPRGPPWFIAFYGVLRWGVPMGLLVPALDVLIDGGGYLDRLLLSMIWAGLLGAGLGAFLWWAGERPSRRWERERVG